MKRFKFILAVVLFISAAGAIATFVEKQFGFMTIFVLIMIGIIISISLLLGVKSRIDALQETNQRLIKDNADKMNIIQEFKITRK